MSRHHLLFFLLGLLIALVALLVWARPAFAPQSAQLLGITSLVPTMESDVSQPTPEYKPGPFTLETVFNPDSNWVATASAERVRTLIVTGDVLTARVVNAHTTQIQDFTWPWTTTADRLRQADVTYINLETPLVPNCPTTTEGMVFCGDVRHVAGLTFAGVDVVNLANNHMGNHGQAGVDSTVQALQAAGLATPGVNDPTYVDVRGQTWAFLGYNEVDQQVGIQLSETDLIKQQVGAARAQADVVIVQFHWGVEYRYHPTAHQQLLARIAIEAGADLIIGNHPHWFQALETYQGKLITYSHGNFIFDQMWSTETRQGLVGKYTFYDNQLVGVEYWPVWIEQYGQPRWLEGAEAQPILDTLKRESEKLQSQ